VISNVALLGRPLLVKIIFFVRSGIVLFFIVLRYLGLYFEETTGVAFYHAPGFFPLYIVLLAVLRSSRLQHFCSNSELGSPVYFCLLVDIDMAWASVWCS